MTYPSIEARILDNVEIQPGPGMTGCWEWQLHLNRDGYARAKFQGQGHERKEQVHRVSYEHFIGEIPVGLQLDHLCRNPKCVNPTHLEPVTNRVNLLRGNTFQAKNKAKTHCLRGHPFEGRNVCYTPDGRRKCRVCVNVQARKDQGKARSR